MWLVFRQHQHPFLLLPADFAQGRHNEVCLRPSPLSLPSILPSDSHSQFQAPPEKPSPWPRVEEWGRSKSRHKRTPATIPSLPSSGRREIGGEHSLCAKPSAGALHASFHVTPPHPLALSSNADMPSTERRPLLFLCPFIGEDSEAWTVKNLSNASQQVVSELGFKSR